MMEGPCTLTFNGEPKTEERPNQGTSSVSELRVVLLGRKGTGKSSAGNTILGLAGSFESGKPTEECVKRRADIASHRVTVVDTPGWEWYYSGNGTPCWVTKETMRSVSLCPPGPHALLLVVRSCASVTQEYYRQVEQQLELLGKSVWAHTMLLFTRGDELGSIPIEQRIQTGGKAFQKLLQRCGNRFHVLENKRCGKDEKQVKELMQKIDAMVMERGGRHYESDPLLLGLEVEAKRRARERRKKQRIMEAQTQKGVIKAVLTADVSSSEDLDDKSLFSRGSRRLPELRLILLGERETGKSSAGNAILNGQSHFQTGQVTEECSRKQAEISGRLVTVVDVPGWEGGPEGITTDRVKREICVSVALCPPGPHAFLLTLRVDALVKAPAVREHLELFGEGIWRHTILLFTRGDQLREGVTIEQHIQGGGRDLHWLMEKCSNRYHVISSICSEGQSSSAQITGLLEKVEKMVSCNRCEAFSPIVQEIQELGKQKNERFNLKLREVSDKLQRQDLELKRMREREVKSIRWFFDRRKVKSPGKATKEKEEEMDKPEEDRKSIMGELEERMAWLTEDKEKEIQELGLENSRVIAALNQAYQEKAELLIRVEEKDKENEDYKEKIDELQVKVLELERICMHKEQERKEKEEEQRKHYEDVENILKEEMDQKEKKCGELMRGLQEAVMEMTETRLMYEEKLLETKQELQIRLAEKKECEKMLEETQNEMKEIKLKTENKVREQEERWQDMNEKWESEKNKLREMIALMTHEMEELQLTYINQVKSAEAERRMHKSTVSKYNRLVDKLVGNEAEITTMNQKQKEQEMAKAEVQNKLMERDAKINALLDKHTEKEKEIEELKQVIDDKQKTVENAKNKYEAEIAEFSKRMKYVEEEYKETEEFLKRENVFLKEEMETVKNLHEESTRKQEDDFRKILEIKENIINQLQQQNEERKSNIDKLKKQQRESETRCEDLKHQNSALTQQFQELITTSDEYKRDLQVQMAKHESKEKEIKAMINKYEEMVKLKDAMNQTQLEEKEKDFSLLKQTNNSHKLELEIMTERGKELELKIEEMKKYYEERLSERIAEMDVKDAEREQSYHNRELELSEREQILRKNLQELERGKRDITRREKDIHLREQKLKDEKLLLDQIQKDLQDEKVKNGHQSQSLQSSKEELEKREMELTYKEKELENKYNDQRELAEKQRKKIENVRQQLEEKEKELKTMEDELNMKQIHLQEGVKVLENLRENLIIQETELRKKQQQLINSEQSCEAKTLELSKCMQELKKHKEENEKLHAELTTKESNLIQRQNEYQQSQQDLLKKQNDINIKDRELQEKIIQMEAHELELLNKQDIQETSFNNCKKELEAIEEALTLKEQNLINTEHELATRMQEMAERLKDLNIREDQINQKHQQCETAEKDLDNRQRDILEKEEKELENIRKQLEEKARELKTIEEEFILKQNNVQEEQKCVDQEREKLEIREKNIIKRERQVMDLQQIHEDKLQRLSENLQELEKTKQDNDRWQAELSNKELNLVQRSSALEKQEQELLHKEHNLQIKTQEQLERVQEVQQAQQQLLNKQTAEECETQLERHKQALMEQEQKLLKKEAELHKREETLQSAEIYLEKRELVVQKKEKEIQVTKQQNDSMLTDLKKKQELIEMNEKEIAAEKKNLISREQNVTNGEQNLSNRLKELETRHNNMEKHQLEVKSRAQAMKKTEQELSEQKTTLQSRTTHLENLENELEKQKNELDIERQVLQMKSEQLEKWGKYLYNMELRMISNNSNANFQPWSQSTELIGKRNETIERMYKELSGTSRTNTGEDTNDECVNMTLSSETTDSAFENVQSTLHKSKRALEAVLDEEQHELNGQEAEIDINGEDTDEYFAPISSDSIIPQDVEFPVSELRLVLIGEAWSSHQSARLTMLGQDANTANPWKGSVFGNQLLVMEPHGIKWRSSKDGNVTFHEELKHSVSVCMPGPHAFILLLPTYLTFTNRFRRAVERTMATLGKTAWRHTIVLFTWGEALGESGQQHIKRNGNLEWLVQSCGGRYHVLDNRHRETQVPELLNIIHKMVAENHGHYYQAESFKPFNP